MSKSFLLMLCILTGLLVLACSRQETNRNIAPSSTNAPVSANTSTNTNRSAGDEVGVAECDSFITAYENCVSTKVPEAGREPLKAAVASWRANWKKLADNPQTRGSLAAACKTQLESARTQMKPYGCTF